MNAAQIETTDVYIQYFQHYIYSYGLWKWHLLQFCNHGAKKVTLATYYRCHNLLINN